MENTNRFNKNVFMALPQSESHKCVISSAVNKLISTSVATEKKVKDALKQYFSCNWGEDILSDKEDTQVNNSALTHGGRILGVYHIDGNKYFIITNPYWQITEVLLADEY